MSSWLFYLVVVLILAAVIALFCYQRRNKKKSLTRKQDLVANFNPPEFARAEKKSKIQNESTDNEGCSPYDPKLIVLQVNAFPGKPYMGYELHQALLAAGLRFGEKNIFHRYESETKEEGRVLFSLAAATSDGSFAIEDMGSFKCNGLLLFMNLDTKRQLMTSFDLMLDTSRQLVEELGGEIYDDLQQLINVDVIKRLREKICTIETSNLYVSDLLDNLD